MLSGDRAIRLTAAAVTVGVAGIAAFVSYRHALEVIRDHGEEGATALLSPLCIDGLLLVASLVMLDSARRGRSSPALAKWALASGIAATVAMNAMHGLDRGPVSAVIAAWPAICLIIVVELLMGMIRRGRTTVTDVTGNLAEVTGSTLVADLPQAATAEVFSRARETEHVPETPALDAPESAPAEIERVPLTLAEVSGQGANLPLDQSAVSTDETPAPVGDPVPAEVLATAREHFAEVLAVGDTPSVRAIRRDLRVGHPRATAIRAALAE